MHDRSLEIDYSAEVLTQKGASLAELGMSRDALETFEKALEQNGNLAEAWMGKGNVLYDLGRHQEAQAAYEKSLDLDPENAIGWTRHGMALAVSGSKRRCN